MVEVFTNPKTGGCRRACGEHKCLMLDIGSNIGFYGILAISNGCEAVFFDVQPTCTKHVYGALQANQFEKYGKVYHLGLSDAKRLIQAPDQGCDGQFYVPSQNLGEDSSQNLGQVSRQNLGDVSRQNLGDVSRQNLGEALGSIDATLDNGAAKDLVHKKEKVLNVLVVPLTDILPATHKILMVKVYAILFDFWYFFWFPV
jgi:hypothetical protein